MIKEANLCTAFFPMGTGGSNLQRTIGLKAPLPRALREPALLPHELDKSLRDCAAQDSAEEVCRFQEKADQVPTPYEGVEVKLRFPISGELNCDFRDRLLPANLVSGGICVTSAWW
jgi:hypothetical protein